MSRVTVLLKCFTWLVFILRQLSKLVVGYSNPPWPTSQLCLPTLHPQCWIKETCNPGNCSHFTLLTWTQMSHCRVGQKAGRTAVLTSPLPDNHRPSLLRSVPPPRCSSSPACGCGFLPGANCRHTNGFFWKMKGGKWHFLLYAGSSLSWPFFFKLIY